LSTFIFRVPDSLVFGRSVDQSRDAMGRQLAREAPVDADIVVPVPDSGNTAAIGYAAESGIPFRLGLIRNHYIGRTFIEPQQSVRDFGVKLKLNAVHSLIEGKRVILVDDSIVRGTTSKKIVRMIRNAGAKEVHMRISCPPTISPCFYGVDTPSKKELIAANKTIERFASTSSPTHSPISRWKVLREPARTEKRPPTAPPAIREITLPKSTWKKYCQRPRRDSGLRRRRTALPVPG
jgi:amidophosphoribosyltransferase